MFLIVLSARWLGIRLQFIGACIVLSAAMFAVASRGHINSGLVGLSITYALQVLPFADTITYYLQKICR